jgi:hypothetical protein
MKTKKPVRKAGPAKKAKKATKATKATKAKRPTTKAATKKTVRRVARKRAGSVGGSASGIPAKSECGASHGECVNTWQGGCDREAGHWGSHHCSSCNTVF